MTQKRKPTKKEAYFIATRTKKGDLDVTFYTKDGNQVNQKDVQKKRTSEGVKFFAAA